MNMLAIAALVRRYAVIRLALLLLVLSPAGPVQLVLCHEAGEAPRVEHALNGQCLSSSQPDCSDCHDTAVQSPPSMESIGHSHCAGCTDQLIGSQHVLRHNDHHFELTIALVSSGVSYTVPLIVPPARIAGHRQVPDLRFCQQPELAIVHSRATRLQI